MATPAMARTAKPPTTLPAMTPALFDFEPPPLGKELGEDVGEERLGGVGPGLAESEGGVLVLVRDAVAEVRPAVVCQVSRVTLAQATNLEK